MNMSRWVGPLLVIPFIAGTITATPAGAEADPFYSQQIEWGPCPAGWVNSSTGVDCATVIVPLDYANPDDGSIEIAVSRKKATDPARRRGILLTNPGGPGGSGLGLVNWFNEQDVAKVYDVIGMDPRGVGKSTQLRCIASSSNVDFPSRPTDAQLSNWTDAARAEEDGCRRGGGEMRKHITTMNTARDMDVIRGALGEKKLNFVGYSYGTHLGSVYGSLFGSTLDRSVLDSALDPLKTWHGSDPDVVDSIAWNFSEWTKWTAARNGTFKLGTTPEAVHAEVEKIAARLTQGPVAGFKTQTQFDQAVGASTRYRWIWASWARTIKQIRDDANNPALAKEVAAMMKVIERGAIEPTSAGTYSAVTCEWDWSTDVNTYYADMRRYRAQMPYGGGVNYGAPTNCTFRAFERPELLPKITRTYPAGLVINSDGDIQTPYANGQMMAEHLREPLISVRNDGQHGHFALRGNACVDRIVNRYLVSGVLPASRTVCAGTDIPENVPPGAVSTHSVQEQRPLSEIHGEIAAANESKPVY